VKSRENTIALKNIPTQFWSVDKLFSTSEAENCIFERVGTVKLVTMATKLTEAYVEDHMRYIEASSQKVGKAVADLLLRSAKEHLKRNGAVDSIKLDGTFELKSFQDVCVDVQVCLPFVGCTTVHIGV